MSELGRRTGVSWCPKHDRYESIFEGITTENDPHEPAAFDDQGEVRSLRYDTPTPDESICDCGLYAVGYRESWAVRHTDGCAYTKARQRL